MSIFTQSREWTQPKNLVLIIGSLILTVVPFNNILVTGIYRWHVLQPEFWQGGLEIVGFGLVVAFLVSKFGDQKIAWLAGFGAIYLSLNGVLIPFLTAYVYFEALLHIGNSFRSLFTNPNKLSGSFEDLLTGIVVWGFVAILASILGHGTISELRLLTVVIFLVSVLVTRNRDYHALSKKFFAFFKRTDMAKWTRVLIIVIVFFVLALAAQSRTHQDYDSLWYGLRPEHVLVGQNSFYDYLGYAEFVFYYPKLMELLLLPVSGLGEYSFIIMGNIFFYAMLIGVLYRLISLLSGGLKGAIQENLALLSILLITTMPALTGMAVSARPDILGCLLVVGAFYFFLDYQRDPRDISRLLFSGTALLLATGTKLTYLLWGGIVFVAIVVGLIFNYLERRKKCERLDLVINWGSISILVLGFLFVLGIHYRTLKLTGFPIYAIFIDQLTSLGFKSIYPALTSVPLMQENVLGFESYGKRLLQLLFDPQELPHVIMQWTSTVWLFLASILVLNRGKKVIPSNPFVLTSATLLAVSAAYYALTLGTPDGNYFVCPIIILLSLGFSRLIGIEKIQGSSATQSVTIFSFLLFICLQVPISFVSSPSWAWGTKAFSSEILPLNLGDQQRNNSVAEVNGWAKIAKYIPERLHHSRILASSSDLAQMNRIDGAIETFDNIDNPHYYNGAIVETYDSFERYVSHARIQAFFLINSDTSRFRQLVEELISKYGCDSIVEDEKAILYILNRSKISDSDRIQIADESQKQALIEGPGGTKWSSGWQADHWIAGHAQFSITSGKSGKISLLGYYPGEITGKEIVAIDVDGKRTEYQIQSENFAIELIAAAGRSIVVQIDSQFDFPATPPDIRRLSFILYDVKVE